MEKFEKVCINFKKRKKTFFLYMLIITINIITSLDDRIGRTLSARNPGSNHG